MTLQGAYFLIFGQQLHTRSGRVAASFGKAELACALTGALPDCFLNSVVSSCRAPLVGRWAVCAFCVALKRLRRQPRHGRHLGWVARVQLVSPSQGALFSMLSESDVCVLCRMAWEEALHICLALHAPASIVACLRRRPSAMHG